MRRFAVIGHLAKTDGTFPLDDLPGSAGRMDLLCRCIQTTFFLSHTLRRDVECYLILFGPPVPPKTILIKGEEVRYLNPDERSTAALLRKALALPTGREFRQSTPGIYIRAAGLEAFLTEHQIALAEEGGEDLRHTPTIPTTFLLSDHLNLTDEERVLVGDSPRYSVSPRSLHADHVITLIHNELDRRDVGWT